MRILSFFLFFGIIYAHKDEAYTNQELTELVNDLSNKLDTFMNIQNTFGKIDDLQVKFDELKSNLTSQESRIQANEADILQNKDIIDNEIDELKTNFNDLVRFTVIATPVYAVIEIKGNEIITFTEPETQCRVSSCDFPSVQNNILNGMNSSTGIFTVPISATYSFFFSGPISCTGNDPILLRVHQTDGSETKTTDLYYGNCDSSNGYYQVHYEWTMTLNQGDQIYLILPNNKLSYVFEFHGQLAGHVFEYVFDQYW